MNTTPLAERNAPSAQVSTKPGELQFADCGAGEPAHGIVRLRTHVLRKQSRVWRIASHAGPLTRDLRSCSCGYLYLTALPWLPLSAGSHSFALWVVANDGRRHRCGPGWRF